MRTVVLVAAFSSFALFSGCMSVSTLQTAKTLEPQKVRIAIGGGYFKAPSLDSALKSDLKFPYLEGSARLGIIPHLDAGVKYTIPGSIFVDGKYQLVDAGAFALATGLGVGYLSLSSSGSDSSKTTSTGIDVQVPVYTSYDVVDWFSLYAAPKYILRNISNKTTGSANEADNTSSSSMDNLVGASVGAKLGSDVGLFAEVTLMHSLKYKNDTLQFGGAFFF